MVKFSKATWILLAALLPLAVISRAALAGAVLVSMAVGQVKDQVLTSREVQASEALEQVLFDSPTNGVKIIAQVESQQFARDVTSLLLEWVVFFEAQSMGVTKVTEQEVARARQKALAALEPIEGWRRLAISTRELNLAIERKLMAKKLIRFRADSSVVPVSDSEAEKYFHQNRLKFGSLPFDNFKPSIKTFLSRQQVEKRLKDWFEVLQAKYSVRNFLSEI